MIQVYYREYILNFEEKEFNGYKYYVENDNLGCLILKDNSIRLGEGTRIENDSNAIFIPRGFFVNGYIYSEVSYTLYSIVNGNEIDKLNILNGAVISNIVINHEENEILLYTDFGVILSFNEYYDDYDTFMLYEILEVNCTDYTNKKVRSITKNSIDNGYLITITFEDDTNCIYSFLTSMDDVNSVILDIII